MARASRQQRRARRAGAADSAYAEQQRERARARREQAEARPAVDAPRPAEAAPAERRRRGSFVRESYGELRKVEWPHRQQVLTGTIAVIIACAIVGAYLWVADLAFKNLVERVLL